MAKPYVIVLGNVCSGKSTFLNRFATLYTGWISAPEDLSENTWLQPKHELSVFHSNVFFMGYNARRHREASFYPGPVIQEACLQHSSIFPQVFYDLGEISLPDLKVLQMNYSVLLEIFPLPDIFVCLHAPVETLLMRADMRDEPNRSVSKKLIPALQDRLAEWITCTLDPSKVIHLDTHATNLLCDDDVFSRVLNEINLRNQS